jgi:glycosyltransferase involved in cell wall biosynthesis
VKHQTKLILFGLNTVRILLFCKIIGQDHVLCVRSNREYLKYLSPVRQFLSVVRIFCISVLKPKIVLQSNYDFSTFPEWKNNPNVAVIFNDLPDFSVPITQHTKKHKRVIFVGNLSSRKQYKLFVEIAKAKTVPELLFEAYGIPVELSDIDVTCHGFVEGREKYHDAHLLVNLSTVDSFPNTILEALSSSVPVKSVALPILEELSFPQETYLSQVDAKSAIEEIEVLLFDREKYNDLLSAQMAVIEVLRFDWENRILSC